MDPSSYKAAMEGKVEELLKKRNEVEVQVTPNNNTVLHVACIFGQTVCAIQILENCSSLLQRLNAEQETPLHIAAREGNYAIVAAFIDSVTNDDLVSRNGLLRIGNEDGDTALHLAVRFRHENLVTLLATKDPGFSHPPNKANETPLYLAAEGGLKNCVLDILRLCTSPSYTGPCGRTALHAAVICNSEGSVAELLYWKKEVAKDRDEIGWAPLHYAACLGYAERASQLLGSDASLAYARAIENENNTALHVASSRGHIDVIRQFLLHSPDCYEMVNDQGKNILHIAVLNNQKEVIKFISTTPFWTSLINRKDIHGNTPLHLYPPHWYRLNPIFGRFLPKPPLLIFNKENLTPLDIILKKYPSHAALIESLPSYHFVDAIAKDGFAMSSRFAIVKDADGNKSIKKDSTPITLNQAIDRGEFALSGDGNYVEMLKKGADNRMIVAALIVTVTFAAGFTMPGGYNGNDNDSNQGMAILSKASAFKAFIISDTIALILSSVALLIYLDYSDTENLDKFVDNDHIAGFCTVVAVFAMMIAFVTGTYASLEKLHALAIATCVVGCMSFVLFGLYIRRSTKASEKDDDKIVQRLKSEL